MLQNSGAILVALGLLLSAGGCSDEQPEDNRPGALAGAGGTKTVADGAGGSSGRASGTAGVSGGGSSAGGSAGIAAGGAAGTGAQTGGAGGATDAGAGSGGAAGSSGAGSGGSGGRPTSVVTHGQQLTPDMVGPKGLGVQLRDLAPLPTPARGYFRCDEPSEWLPNRAYVYNNDLANHGGTVAAGGMTIDGVPYPQGTVVIQFRSFSTEFYCQGANVPHILFRGCSFRGAPFDPPGWLNTAYLPASVGISLHYVDFGGLGAQDAQRGGMMKLSGGGGGTVLRSYSTYTGGPLQINVSGYDVIENFFDKITFYFGEVGPDGVPGGSDVYHINGIFLNGGERNIRILRNKVLVPSPDDAGRVVPQTDCIALFQDFGQFAGDGRNRDGTMGYQILDNYVGGSGYTFYAGRNSGTPESSVKNVVLSGNKVTTTWWPNGGRFGTVTAEPVWGSFGNEKRNNTWADGAHAGETW